MSHHGVASAMSRRPCRIGHVASAAPATNKIAEIFL
jgi:hypothetical protein